MIAYVYAGTAPREWDDLSEADREAMAALTEGASRIEGSHQLLVLVDPETRHGMTIQLWRDREAFERFRKEQQGEMFEKVGGRFPDSWERVYEVEHNLRP